MTFPTPQHNGERSGASGLLEIIPVGDEKQNAKGAALGWTHCSFYDYYVRLKLFL